MTLELEGLTKVYKDKTALDDVSFSFTPGIYGLLGPNGAGKSTMMNLISDNLTPSKGRVLLDGRGIDELGSEYRKLLGYMPQQVQDFYPTPSTMSTVMYYTGIDPRDMKPVYVVKNPHEKAMQRALIQYKNPENYELVKEALLKMHREDLIGFGPKCLIPPRKMEKKEKAQNLGQKNANFKNQKHKNGKGIKNGNSGKNKKSSKNNSNTVNRKKRK